jgi:hypothetical protein
MSLHSQDTLESIPVPPLRVALLSDVHGNLPAFQTVLADIEQQGVDAIWCLGDLVGYGAQPDECVALAKEACDLVLIGNHDLVVIDKLDIAEFSGDPRAAWLLLDLATWTATWRRVEYPIDDAARAIQQAGLPVALSDRLYYGQ